MAENVQVRSVDTIEAFRRSLVVYIAKAKPLVEDAWDDVARMREWLRSDRRLFWENELRKRKQILQQAQEAYLSARLSILREATTAEMSAVRKAEASVSAAEEKLRTIKHWTMEFEHSIWPLLKQLDQVRTSLTNDLPAAARHLAEIVRLLENYTGGGAELIPKQVEQLETNEEAL